MKRETVTGMVQKKVSSCEGISPVINYTAWMVEILTVLPIHEQVMMVR